MRAEKVAIFNEITDRLRNADCTILLGYGGLTVDELYELRRAILPLQGKATIAKNTMIGLAAKALEWDENITSVLTGPTAIVTGKGDASELAKLVVKFAKAHEKAEIKGASLDSKFLQTSDVTALSELPSREVMQSMLLGTLAAPMSGLVGVFSQKLLSLLYVLKAVETKKGEAAA